MLNLLKTMLNLVILPCLYTATLFATIFAIILFVTYHSSSSKEKSVAPDKTTNIQPKTFIPNKPV